MTANDRQQLPIPDYDHLPVGSLSHRVRALNSDGVAALLEYERSHGNRMPVLQVLQSRLDALASGATPSGGAPDAPAPELAEPPQGGSSVGPATEGPVINPPSHGVPTNPAQPRSTG